MNETELLEQVAEERRQLDQFVQELHSQHAHELRVLNTRIANLTERNTQLQQELEAERMA